MAAIQANDHSDVLGKLWDAEQEILDTVDGFCRKHNLRYSLAYGTLLGAVRHKGFIPRDDDVDIMMPREDYEQFKRFWRQDAPAGYILQDEEDENGFFNNFMKIRKDHTTFLQFEVERDLPLHKGIFVDVFPADKEAPGRLLKRVQRLDFLLCLLYNRGHSSKKSKPFSHFCEELLLKLVPRRKYRKVSVWFGRRGRRWNHLQSEGMIFPTTNWSCRHPYPGDLFDNLQKAEFRGKEYSISGCADRYLTIQYGDYMKLPPENKRVWTHHPIILDFNRNYEELTEEEKRGQAS